MAQFHYPYTPALYLVLDRFDNEKKVGRIHVPELMVNGTLDDVVPPSHGERLYERANEPRKFVSLTGHGHIDLLDDCGPMILDWVNKLPMGAG